MDFTGTWPFEERSTRNCIHAKVSRVAGSYRVQCSEGKHLAKLQKNGAYGLALKMVLRTAHFMSDACENCMLFEHDEV